MSKRLARLLTLIGALALLSGLLVGLRAGSPPRSPDRAPDFRLPDTAGRPVALGDFKDHKAVVVVFIGTECPINNAYAASLAEMHREFAPRGVQFLAINSNCLDSAQDVAEHARLHAIPFPVLKDEGNVVADRFGARRTPEAFVLDPAGAVRYRGRIDDQYGIGYRRPKPARRDLAEALEEVLAGKPVSRPRTDVAGCLIARAPAPKAQGPVTYARDVAPILQKNCQECHRPGRIGPMPLMTYEDAAAWSGTIREVVQERRMPPWHADPRFGHFLNDRRLADAERDTLLAWIDHGAPRGDDRELPPPRDFPEGWTIGRPELIVSMPEEYAVPAAMPRSGIPYQNIFVDPGFTEDKWVERAETHAGAPGVVHHIIIFIVPPGKRFFPGNPETPALAGTAPGDMPLILRPGMAKKVPAHSRLVFQMHYTPNGAAQKDRSQLGLIFAREPPKYEVQTAPVANPAFRIPPGADNYRVEAWFKFEAPARVVAFMPHMHLRGKDFLYEAVYPDGRTETLLSVPQFNFNWQSIYRLAEPLALPKGTRIHCVAHFDNSAANPNNPDPTRPVYWGDQTWEEMMIGWMDYSADRKQN